METSCRKCHINLAYPESKTIGLCYECAIPNYIPKEQHNRYRKELYKKKKIPYTSKDELERPYII